MKEVEKMAVDGQGNLVKTGTKEINLDNIQELQTVNYTPVEGEVVLQPLTQKEVKTTSGLYLPENKKELRAAVVKVNPKDNSFKRGQVVRLEGSMFGQGVPVDYIDGKPCLQVPKHFIRGIYDNIDLNNWKAE